MEISPLELALRSFAAFGTFHHILLTTCMGIEWFTRVECTMPWCTDTQQTLDNLFTIDSGTYRKFNKLFSGARSCFVCREGYQHEGVKDWHEVVGLVRSGKPWNTLLEFGSEEEESRLRWTWKCCESCREKTLGTMNELNSDMRSASEDLQAKPEEDDHEIVCLIDTEVSSSNLWRMTGLKPGIGTVSSDEDLEDEDSSDGNSSEGVI